MKSVAEVRDEFRKDYLRRHWSQGARFLREIQPLLAASAPDSPPPSGTDSQPVHPSSPSNNAADSASSQPVRPSSPFNNAPTSLLEELRSPDPAVHEAALQSIAVRLAEGLSRRVSRIARRVASG